jgi:hypothetical protein
MQETECVLVCVCPPSSYKATSIQLCGSHRDGLSNPDHLLQATSQHPSQTKFHPLITSEEDEVATKSHGR